MVRRNVYVVVVALLFATTVIHAQQPGQFILKLPDGLAVTNPIDGKPALLRYANERQTFEAQAREVSVVPAEKTVLVRMATGNFTWTTAGQPAYKNSFRHLELRFETASGNLIEFRIVD